MSARFALISDDGSRVVGATPVGALRGALVPAAVVLLLVGLLVPASVGPVSAQTSTTTI